MSNFFTDLAREYTGNQSKHDILFTNIQNGKGIRVMPEETKQQPEWITLGEAASHESVKVTRETLRRMIKRNDGSIPDECWREIQIGSRTVYQIDANCLSDIEYGTVGRPPKTEQ